MSTLVQYRGEPPGGTFMPAPGGGEPMEISSGQVILNRPFDLAENAATTITLDFDGDRSIRETAPGIYRMAPVIRVLSVVSVP